MPQVRPSSAAGASLTKDAADDFDVVVIGSGFGGAMTALTLVESGFRVLMVERGGWVERKSECWNGEGAFVRTPFYAADAKYGLCRRRKV